MALDQQQAAEETYEVFAAATPSFRPYATDAVADGNLAILVKWIRDVLPRGLAAASEVGSWEISFRENKDKLTRDPNFVAPLSAVERDSVFRKLFDSLTSDQCRAIDENRIAEHFRPLTEAQAQMLAQIGGAVAFKNLTDRMYQ